MHEIKKEIWGREFTLLVEFDLYDGEEFLPEQNNALNALLMNWEVVDASRAKVEEYILNHDGEVVDNIFRYVHPSSLFVKRTIDTRTVALMCDYRIDDEHGIAIVFVNEQLYEVGSQDIIL